MKSIVILLIISLQIPFVYADPDMPSVVGCYNYGGCDSVNTVSESNTYRQNSRFTNDVPGSTILGKDGTQSPIVDTQNSYSQQTRFTNDIPSSTVLAKSGSISPSVGDQYTYKIQDRYLNDVPGSIVMDKDASLSPSVTDQLGYKSDSRFLNDIPASIVLVYNTLVINKNMLPWELQSLIHVQDIKNILLLFDKNVIETLNSTGSFNYDGSQASYQNTFNTQGVTQLKIVDIPSSNSTLSDIISNLSTTFNTVNSRIMKIGQKALGVNNQ